MPLFVCVPEGVGIALGLPERLGDAVEDGLWVSVGDQDPLPVADPVDVSDDVGVAELLKVRA